MISKSFWHPVAGKATFSFMASSLRLKRRVEKSRQVDRGWKSPIVDIYTPLPLGSKQEKEDGIETATLGRAGAAVD